MTPEHRRLVEDAMTLLARVPGYSGAAVVIFTRTFGRAETHAHGVSDELLNEALASLLKQRVIEGAPRSPLILPGGRNGSG